jgi:hypothetical protein
MNIPIPKRLEKLPFSKKWNLPVPWFVAWIDGEPEFRVAEGDAWVRAVRDSLCWICGEKLGIHRAFLIGPMCSINRVSADPPMHRECAEYSVKVCPFLTTPKMVRREKDRPPEEMLSDIPGLYIARNPGVTLLWVAREYKLVPADPGYLFRLTGAPEYLQWYAEGRPATRAEVDESIVSGFPTLYNAAKEEGDKAIKALLVARAAAEQFLPNASPADTSVVAPA